jgi:hypothetical protein
MAGLRPKILTNLIYQGNSSISTNATIPFKTLETTLKNLILQFTTTLFTKLNYAEIFASQTTIPPYNILNRTRLCLNLARLHLYLTVKYQPIDFKKFSEDLPLRPKRFRINSNISSTDENKRYLTIDSNTHFNIELSFNLPKALFLEKFNIPSLKNSLTHFEL